MVSLTTFWTSRSGRLATSMLDQPVGSPGDVDAADHLQECPGDVAPTCIAVVVPGAFAIVDGSKRRPEDDQQNRPPAVVPVLTVGAEYRAEDFVLERIARRALAHERNDVRPRCEPAKERLGPLQPSQQCLIVFTLKFPFETLVLMVSRDA